MIVNSSFITTLVCGETLGVFAERRQIIHSCVCLNFVASEQRKEFSPESFPNDEKNKEREPLLQKQK